MKEPGQLHVRIVTSHRHSSTTLSVEGVHPRVCQLLFFVLSLLLASQTHAALAWQLENDRLTDQERRASWQLLDDVAAVLPPLFTDRLDGEFQVRWKDRLPEDVMGRATFHGRIELNRRWLPALVAGTDVDLPAGRAHSSLRRELLATLVHELTHFYDRGQHWSPSERRLLLHCQRQRASVGKIGLPQLCRGQAERQFTLSDDPRLLDLAGWPEQIGQRGQRETVNRQLARSPDSYELTNPREFVAVNLEYFLLDPQYGCRRPALRAYFRKHFGWAPEQVADCPDSYPYVNASLDKERPALGSLDPDRIYEVHYLLAEPNQEWASRWGHSMLRVVMCAPGKEPGPACLLDVDHHLVLSFRAFVDDVQLSSWDGLTGAYPSRLFILPLTQVVDEYTKLELRGLQSVPLRLSRREQLALVERAAELHWSYDGTYYFLANNCAVETLKLLRSGSNRADLRGLESITPTGLLQGLEAHGLADYSVLQNRREAMRLGYYFDSFRERYQLMFNVVRERLQVPQQQVEDWLALTADERQPWLEQSDQRSAAALLLLEQAAQRRQSLVVQQELKARYLSGRQSQDAEVAQAGDLMRKLLTNSGFLSRPAELLDEGYGLPQHSERRQLAQVSGVRQQRLLDLAESLDQRLLRLLSNERQQELENGERNIKQLGEHLRRLHKTANGLVLP
ncbi:hypothetical protein LCGC14_0125350 [marine sediment metagenome]|uniref:Uncharacterized protein n=1 Tax=marine sediment metagenome TaxID=412755 RepID=A0A0F9Y748_9ZZZZ